MILIAKPTAPPASLSKGGLLVAQCETALSNHPGVAGSAKQPFSFDETIYNHRTVKIALKNAQHNKCCYCEAYFAGNAPGDVEHFRPKTYSQQVKGGQKYYPGYYWLAYQWRNLYYACDICNRSAKRNLFPLRDNSRRARRASDALGNEQPMLLDPSGPADPRDHIKFVDFDPVGISDLGRCTVETLQLGRTDLNTARWLHWQTVDALWRVASSGDSVDSELRQAQEKARALLKGYVRPQAVFSAMTQDFLSAQNYVN